MSRLVETYAKTTGRRRPVRVPRPTRRRLEVPAKSEGRSLSQPIGRLIEAGLERLVGLKDPMDRLVVAAARATRPRLVSIDAALDGFGVERLWD